jgi:thiamine biosynthesis lipoprotein
MNRREFLHPQRIAQTTGQVLGAVAEVQGGLDLGEQPPEVPSSSEVVLLRLSHRAMATAFEIFFPFGVPHAATWGQYAFELLDELETQLTVYRDSSEVSQLNRLAPYQAVPVEEGLFSLLERAARLTEETQGAFDISVGALIKTWGFFRGPARVPTEGERQQARERSGMRWVELLPENRSVRYRRPGVEINLGSIGKGYALDRLAALLFEEGKIPTGLLHGGQSSVYARGRPNASRGWKVGISHPWKPRRLANVWLCDQAMGTSAATFRHLEHQGRKLGHVLDPRTGWPAEGLASATALAASAAEADALATAFFILGAEGTRTYCEAHPEVGAILLPPRPDAPPIVFNLGPDVLELTPTCYP